MSYFARHGIKTAKPHQYVAEYAGNNGAKSARTFMKRANRRFVRHAAKHIDNDE